MRRRGPHARLIYFGSTAATSAACPCWTASACCGIVPAQDTCPVRYVDHIAERGVDLFAAVCAQDLEGVVAKRADGLYTPDATTWVKIKNAAYTQNVGRRAWFEERWAGITRNICTLAHWPLLTVKC